MQPNLGGFDRATRAVVALPLGACAFLAPLPLTVRLLAFALPALYMLGTAIMSRCLGYALMGRNTCPVSRSR